MTEGQIASGATQPEPRARRRTAATPGVGIGLSSEPGANLEPLVDDRPHVHHVHFLEDGVTALDKVFVRGEEVEIKDGSAQWEMMHNKDGTCLFALTREEQIRKYGKQLWAEGPWPFDPYDLQARLDNGETLTAEEQAVLQKENEKRERARQQPVGYGPRRR